MRLRLLFGSYTNGVNLSLQSGQVSRELDEAQAAQLQRDYPGRFEPVVEREPEAPAAVSEPDPAPPRRGRRARS